MDERPHGFIKWIVFIELILDDMTPRVGNDDGGNSDRGISVVAGQPFEDFLAVPKRRRRQTANDQTSDGGGKRCPVRRVARRASVR